MPAGWQPDDGRMGEMAPEIGASCSSGRKRGNLRHLLILQQQRSTEQAVQGLEYRLLPLLSLFVALTARQARRGAAMSCAPAPDTAAGVWGYQRRGLEYSVDS